MGTLCAGAFSERGKAEEAKRRWDLIQHVFVQVISVVFAQPFSNDILHSNADFAFYLYCSIHA